MNKKKNLQIRDLQGFMAVWTGPQKNSFIGLAEVSQCFFILPLYPFYLKDLVVMCKNIITFKKRKENSNCPRNCPRFCPRFENFIDGRNTFLSSRSAC